jgi:hypothetical protein
MAKTVDLMKSLYHLGKIRLSDTGPEILDQNVLIVPQDLFRKLIELYADNPLLEQAIYRVMRDSVYEFCDEIDSHEDLEPAELMQVLLNLTRLNGFGDIEIADYDSEKHMATFYVWNLPSDDVDAAYSFKGDTYWAGMLAGGMTYVFDRYVEALETQCILEDENSCQFVVAAPETLQTEYPDLYRAKFEKPLAA